MHKLSIVLFIIASGFIAMACTANRKVEKQFKMFHENEMLAAVNDFYDYVDKHNDFFILGESDSEITVPIDFSSLITKIIAIHTENHNSEKLPRDSKEWSVWMHNYKPREESDFELTIDSDGYSVVRLKEVEQKRLITVCPFCLAEQAGNLSEGERNLDDWIETSLFEYKIDKRITSLLKVMKNDEIKNALNALRIYMKTGAMFGQKLTSDWILQAGSLNDRCYVIPTRKYLEIKQKMQNIHENFHKFYMFDGVVEKTLFHYFSEIGNGGNFLEPEKPISSCPFCVFLHEAITDGRLKKDMKNFSWPDGEMYIWRENGFGLKILTDYVQNKNDEKQKIAERKRIRDIPLYSLIQIQNEVEDNKIVARKKYDGKQLKIGAYVKSVQDDHVVLATDGWGIGETNIFLSKSDLETLRKSQYIEFFATIKFIDLSNVGKNDTLEEFQNGASSILEYLDYGGSGYALLNCQLIE
mgnify:CR=1 FL=1